MKQYGKKEVIFGTKPVEILIPYIKTLTKRGDLIIEPFGGSGGHNMNAMQKETTAGNGPDIKFAKLLECMV